METEESSSNFRQLDALKETNETQHIEEQQPAVNVQNELNSSAKFDALIDTVLTNFSEVQGSVQDLLRLKDDLLLHYLPPPMLFRVALVIGKVYRNFSDLNTPVYEMLRLVKIFSASWEKNSAVLKKLHDMYESKKQMLNIAIKRLALIDKKTKLFARERRISNWEKLYIKLSEAKGHGRRWKFQIETFRKKADEGYDQLVHWLMKDATEDKGDENREGEQDGDESKDKLSLAKSKKDKKEKKDRDDKFDMMDLKSPFDDDKKDDNFMITVDSDQDLFSGNEDDEDADNRRTKKKERESKLNPKKSFAEAEAQTTPDVEDKTVWTGEPDYKRYFIIRLFKPPEYNNRKLRFKISMGETTYTSKPFEGPKTEKKVKIVETKGKKGKKSEPEPEIVDKKLDTTNFEDFLFEINDQFKKKEVLSTKSDNFISFEMKSEEKDKDAVVGFSNVPMDDIHTLDPPLLYYKANLEADVIDYYDNSDKPKDETNGSETAASWLRINDLTIESIETYSLMSNRLPFNFDMYKKKDLKSPANFVCKLPVMFFWIRKPFVLTHHKNTGCQSVNDIVLELTGIDLNKSNKGDIEQIIRKKETSDISCSPIHTLKTPEPTKQLQPDPVPTTPIRPPSTPLGSIRSKSFDVIDKVNNIDKESSGNLNSEEIQALHEDYQMRLDQLQLTIYNLENELAQQKALNELKEESKRSKYAARASISSFSKMHSEKLKEVQSSIDKAKTDRLNDRNKERERRINDLKTPKQSDPMPAFQKYYNPHAAMWGKDLPDDFFERLKLFSDKSSAHHKEIIDKYMNEEAYIREQQMAVQHRLDNQTDNKLDDFCLPAVFMPYKSPNNVFNPRAHRYFHPTGSNDVRLTQPPTVFQLPPLPSKSSLSVINLFDLGKRYQAGEPDYYINQYVANASNKLKTEATNNLKINNENALIEEENEFVNENDNIEIHLDKLNKDIKT